MGHKVNALSFRLKTVWDFFWYFKNRNDILNIKDLQLKNYLNKICLKKNKILYNFSILRNLGKIVIFFDLYALTNFNYKKLKKEYKILKKILNFRLKLYINFYFYGDNFKVDSIFLFFRKNFNKFKKAKKKEKKFLKYYRFYINIRQIFNLIRVSFSKLSSELLLKGIRFFFKKVPGKRQRFFFNIISNIMFFFFKNYTGIKKILGFKLEIKGKINGKMRKKKQKMSGGSMPLSTVSYNISFDFIKILTKYGIFGFKFWFFLSNSTYYSKKFFNFKKFEKYLKKNVPKTKKNKI